MLDDYPALLDRQIRLAYFIKKKYGCLLCEALRLMLPAQMRGGRVRDKTVLTYAAAVKGEELKNALASLKNAKVQREILGILAEAGTMSVKDLSLMYPGARSALGSLEKKGYAEPMRSELMRSPYSSLTRAAWLIS
jgi:primosomal protein N' (replication factor Y)